MLPPQSEPTCRVLRTPDILTRLRMVAGGMSAGRRRVMGGDFQTGHHEER